jgi:hypothetical protein
MLSSVGKKISPTGEPADSARASLGAAAFDAAWAQGRALTFEPAAEEAVARLQAALQVQPRSA